MKEWKIFRLSELGTVVGGATPSTKVVSNYDGDISWITPKDLSSFSGRYIFRGERNISELGLNSCSCQILPKGSILFSSRAPIGYIAIAGKELCTNQGFKSIIPDEEIVDSRFLYYLLKFNKERIARMGSGTTFMEVSGSVMKNVEVSIPSKAEQERIADILSSIDDKIELNDRINHNLEEQAQALYKSWFVDYEPFKDGGLSDSELGSIPVGWSIQSLDSLCSIISRGFSPSYNDNSEDLVLGQRCVRNNLIDTSLARRHNPKNLGERQLKKWDILINSTGMGSLGRVAQLFFDPKKLTFDSHLTLVRTKKDCYKQFVGRNLLARQDEIENMAVGSTGQTELPRDRVRAMSVICPPEQVMRSFGDVIEALSNTIQSNIEMNESLSRERDELLPKLMSGVFDLTTSPN